MKKILNLSVLLLAIVSIGCGPEPVAKTIDPPQVATAPEPEPAPIPDPEPIAQPQPVDTKMTKDPNGRDWPRGSGYLRGIDVRNNNGLSSLTIDNTGSDNSYFVKLVDVSSGRPHGVRYIKVNGGSSFTMKNLSPSQYEIRYKDIVTRSAAKSEPFGVRETVTETYQGRATNFSNIRITLYTIAGGNTQMTPIREEDF
jgi:hypothetical protein